MISLVIPMFNEAGNVQALLDEIQSSLQDGDAYEVIVVDDGSTDNTAEIVKSRGVITPAIRLVQHLRNCGQSAALLSGVQAARGEWIVTLDGDGQNDPADIPSLLKQRNLYSPCFLLVAGNRIKRRDSWIRRLSSQIANRVRSTLLHDHCPDSGCGLKLFRREDFLQLPHFDHLHRFLPALFIRAGGQVVNIPVNHRPRLHGQSKYGVGNRLWVGITDLLGVIWLDHRQCRPDQPS